MAFNDKLSKNLDGAAFPLLFAKKICVATGLWEFLEEPDPERRYEQNESLKMFQQMSITCNFKNSLIAYHDYDLTEDHRDGLELIHQATKSWIKGEVVGVLMQKISDKKITNRDFAASIAIILDQLETEGRGKEGKSGGGGSGKNKELVVRMAKMQDVQELAEKE